ncbi:MULTISPECIES: carbohydrate kinase family protein [Achromobacter]|uniref:Adenosine kinase n=1 Tax=Achromobacter aegrifaciens TaxID=1287736 RepID=A0AAD2J5C4_ACHAE|nr:MULTISPECIES: carbohydrate kinase family protein [Achromobacter]PTN52832.1 carbohydrate kinase family protein [Achromobacter xylosoxidans]MBD9385006.1 carbohydrate kinase family protein [Achromobacter sp. ACM02]MBD9422053.1 carbohydrate kinase family protein [Achromobacter sp. ACM04]MBD9434051.1 carbohydrate kinase family protein [Achromobacter sp. ACM03]MDQ1759772.1 carbohydrate kinase family protein [Achromobacter aegrifaciens]
MATPVLVCGSMAFDTIAVFEGRFKEHILADRIQSLSVSFLVPSMRKEYGGCSGNIAYNMNLLGGKPVPVATVGEDAGEYMERMAGLGIDVSRVKVIPETFTAQCFITTDLDDNQITAFHPGAMSHAAENDLSDADAAWAIVAPDAKEGMFAHAERLHKRGIPFIFDLGQAMPLFDGADLERMLKLAQALTVNDYEAGVVEQRTGRSMDDIARSLQAVVVTRGAEGATLLTEGKTIQIPPVRAAQVVDPTGCGDAQRGGLLYGLTSGWNWEDSCRLGNVMGAIKIASRGPQNHAPSRAEIDAVLHATYGIHLPL